jgi:hypothetical protein
VEDYDSLSTAQQAVVRARWRVEFDRSIAALDFKAEFETAGSSPYSELDEAGGVVTRYPQSS